MRFVNPCARSFLQTVIRMPFVNPRARSSLQTVIREARLPDEIKFAENGPLSSGVVEPPSTSILGCGEMAAALPLLGASPCGRFINDYEG